MADKAIDFITTADFQAVVVELGGTVVRVTANPVRGGAVEVPSMSGVRVRTVAALPVAVRGGAVEVPSMSGVRVRVVVDAGLPKVGQAVQFVLEEDL